ncbi:hypothetical protein FHG87_011384 [Trinorchestia longiramus]|nr:hypothetical protein FHG87_011384 [Trinorchestia longiramus]
MSCLRRRGPDHQPHLQLPEHPHPPYPSGPLAEPSEVLELNAAVNDLPHHLRQLEDILQRIDIMQLSAEYNSSLQSECQRLEVAADQSDDSLDTVIQRAKSLLQKSGFLPPDRVGIYFHANDGKDSN